MQKLEKENKWIQAEVCFFGMKDTDYDFSTLDPKGEYEKLSKLKEDNAVLKRKVNMKVEYECAPTRHLAVQCPDCESWFHGFDIIEGDCTYSYQLRGAKCKCPKCGSEFKTDYESNIEESGELPAFYDNCLKQKVTWE